MPSKTTVLSVPVQVNTEIFRDFAAFDVWTRQKRWQRPLVFALILLAGAVICFSQAGKREGAVLLGSVLTLVGLGLPAVYVTMFFQSVNRQAKRMGLAAGKDTYRVELDEEGVCMRPAGAQDKEAEAVAHTWAQVYGAWRTPRAIYLYVTGSQAYLLPADQIPGGADRAWDLLRDHLPAGKLHTTR